MAFEITKHTIFQLIASMGCGCKKIHEFEDSTYAKAVGEGIYSGCAKHAGKESGDTISLILGEYLETEAKHVAETSIKQVAPDVQVDEHGNVITVIEVPKKSSSHHRRATLSSMATPHTPEVVDPGESGDAMDALLASEDPSEPRVNIIPPRSSKS